MSSINKVMLIGRVGKDPEVRYLESGTKCATFSIATDESYKDQSGQKVEKAEWHKIVLWKNQADLAEKYIRKGSHLYIEGKLQTRSWDDQATGQKRFMTEIVGNTVRFLSSRAEVQAQQDVPEISANTPTTPMGKMNSPQQGQPASAPAGNSAGDLGYDPQDDLPF